MPTIQPLFWRRALWLVGTLLMGALLVGANGDAATPWGTKLAFHGWAPSGRYVAYTRTRTKRPARGTRKPATTVRHAHKRVEDGEMRMTGARFGKDAGRFARRHGYIQDPVKPRVVGPYIREFVAPEGTYTFQLHVTQELRWELSLNGTVLMEQPFDTLYVDIDVALFPSPDRRHVALVLHLDTGWIVDGGFYVTGLPEQARARWQETALVGPPLPTTTAGYQP